jgi:lysophospholipase L1-like esterase
MIGLRMLILLFGFFSAGGFFRQTLPDFSNELLAFKRADSIAFPAENQILLIGSSSFTNWKDVQDYFPGSPILNRAFGGSQLLHLLQHQYEIIDPYKPKKIVVYCGENDLSFDESLPADSVVSRFTQLFTDIRKRLPQVPVIYVSLKPSPARRHLMPKFEEANAAIRSYLHQHKHTTYIDVYHDMLLENGQPNPALFMSDSLHMNKVGYEIWQKTLLPNL